jgi:hypothetical protein
LSCSGPLQCEALLRRASSGIGPVAAPLAPIPWPCFLPLPRRSAGQKRILQLRRGLPLRRTWIEQPYGEEEITILEEEVIPAIQRCLARSDELDQWLLAEQELLHRCQLEAEREALGALKLQMA